MQPDPTPSGASGPWPVFNLHERRVLGVLVEKAKTTPDAYPMSVNALVTGCNQKSNRDPLLSLTEEDVEDTLVRLQRQGLAVKITGGRVERWRHTLYESWRVDKVDLAVLAELLLRGPQTEGELRTRASRMEPLDDLDALRRVLRPLVERNLVVYLTPEERRGAVLTHGFHEPRELEALRARHAAEPPTAVASVPAPVPPARDVALAELKNQVATLETAVGELRDALAATRAELRDLKASLGV